jgi:hypothetical protein
MKGEGVAVESLPTEDTSTTDPEEAQLWVRAYRELSSQVDVIVREGSPSDIVNHAANRFQQRLQFWSTRYRQLRGY